MSIQTDMRARRLLVFVLAFFASVVTAVAALSRLPDDLRWLTGGIFIGVNIGVQWVFGGRFRCPRCASNLAGGDRAPPGVRDRGVWIERRGLPDRCGRCGLDLTVATEADFATPETRTAFERANAERKEKDRRDRTFG